MPPQQMLPIYSVRRALQTAHALTGLDGGLPGSVLLRAAIAVKTSSLPLFPHFPLPLLAMVGGFKSLQHNVDLVINVLPFFMA